MRQGLTDTLEAGFDAGGGQGFAGCRGAARLLARPRPLLRLCGTGLGGHHRDREAGAPVSDPR